MEIRTYPYRAWVLNQMGKPKSVLFVERAGLPSRRDLGDVTNKGKIYPIDKIFPTKEQCRLNQEGNIMGYNSTVVVMNDALHDIERDPDFSKKLVAAIAKAYNRGSVNVSAGYHCNAATVIDSQHADVVSIIAVGGNHGSVLTRSSNGGRHHSQEDQELLLRRLAHQFGYNLHKKPK